VEIISGAIKIEKPSHLNPGEQLIYDKSDESVEIKKLKQNGIHRGKRTSSSLSI